LYVVHDKEVKTILTASYQLIQELADIQEGSVIKIKRKYINEKTIYEVGLLKKPKEILEQLMPYVKKLKEYKKNLRFDENGIPFFETTEKIREESGKMLAKQTFPDKKLKHNDTLTVTYEIEQKL